MDLVKTIIGILICYVVYYKGYIDGKEEIYYKFSFEGYNTCILGKPFTIIFKNSDKEEFILLNPSITKINCPPEIIQKNLILNNPRKESLKDLLQKETSDYNDDIKLRDAKEQEVIDVEEVSNSLLN